MFLPVSRKAFAQLIVHKGINIVYIFPQSAVRTLFERQAASYMWIADMNAANDRGSRRDNKAKKSQGPEKKLKTNFQVMEGILFRKNKKKKHC